jgi:broad specificity phosphatase PhoE
MAARRFTLLRHAQSTYNVRGILNGDPGVPVPLTDEGRRQAEAAHRLLAHVSFDLAVHTRFLRTSETLLIVLGDRRPPIAVYPEFDDLDVGDFEGLPLATYREWRSGHDPDDGAPGGESRIDGLRRYVAGYQRLLESGAHHVVAVLHDVPIRFLVNAIHDTDPIAGPHQSVANAMPITYTEDDLRRGVERMAERAEMRRAG